jgi:hypothetical protein
VLTGLREPAARPGAFPHDVLFTASIPAGRTYMVSDVATFDNLTLGAERAYSDKE